MIYYTEKKHYEDHLSNDYASFARFVGEQLRYIEGLRDLHAEPNSARLIAEYKNTILVEFEFIDDVWHTNNTKPRYIKRAIPKALLATGEVKFVLARSGEPLYGSAVSSRVLDAYVCIY